MKKKQLTKTLIKSSINCPRQLHMELSSPELRKVKDDAFLAHLAREGYRFEDIVVSMFPAGKAQETFESKDVLIRTDLIFNEALMEIKSSTGIRAEDILDLAIQVQVLKELNKDPGKYLLAFVNREYVLNSTLDVEMLVRFEDVTEQVCEVLPEIELMLMDARKLLKSKKKPEREVGRHCLQCPFLENCSPELKSYSVFNLRRGGAKIDDLLNTGIYHLKEIPASVRLSDFQQLQVDIEKKSTAYIDRSRIEAVLNTLEYPVYYLDFEAAPILVPRYEGCSPYEQITFQVSIHIEDSPGSELSHIEFLHDEDSDPRNELGLFLDKNIGDIGSIVTYHASYEKGRMLEIMNCNPKLSNKMNNLIDRLWDLETIFTKGYYLSSEFCGSTSIKKVLPVLVPELNYQDLDISNGADAFISYLEMIDDKTTSRKKREIYNSLLQYCKMDTYAMYAIMEALREVCHE